MRKRRKKSSITEETPNGVILKILQIRGLKDQKTPPPPTPQISPNFTPPGTPKTQKKPSFWAVFPIKSLQNPSLSFHVKSPPKTPLFQTCFIIPPDPHLIGVSLEELSVDHPGGGEGRQIPSK